MRPERTAVVLFNLGGPDSPEAVKPFLFNLFTDPAIIGLPNPFRWMLAKLISSRREKEAQHIYGQIGGRSPLLPLTEEQKEALERELGDGYRVFIAMRYWRPFTDETVREVKVYDPQKVILLPLYPQFSTTTTASSLRVWKEQAGRSGIAAEARAVCCYFRQEDFVAAHAELLEGVLKDAPAKVRVLFSAHGLPKKVIYAGDPYQWQVQQTAEAIRAKVRIPEGMQVEFAGCFQSRVGPLEWIGPSTEEEIRRAAADGIGIIVLPIAFVSEHSETLVELDIQYRELARELGIPFYGRVPALGTHPKFIDALASLCRQESVCTIGPASGARMCGPELGKCPCPLAV